MGKHRHWRIDFGRPAVLRVKDTLAVTVSGASNLSYHGTPRLDRISTSGGSTVKSLD